MFCSAASAPPHYPHLQASTFCLVRSLCCSLHLPLLHIASCSCACPLLFTHSLRLLRHPPAPAPLDPPAGALGPPHLLPHHLPHLLGPHVPPVLACQSLLAPTSWLSPPPKLALLWGAA